nr:amidohydrolase family protein [candidate division KSB1 bacterium]NIR72521.1 amidohydrolase family protein [candidate division KSB1 bacterium]NIS23820.1 amidohydrolase family protein [candidate division KSB1 bacterium]NIT70747.1 amidohydrolase family protein [candidate division KSB1 bacterium]NIU24262.1 amidohydrolase family protein [candidate division KSB1 bacterium]
VITPNEGIFSGSSAVVSLADGPANDQLLRDNVSQNIMFKRPGGFRSRAYPNSLMGVIALIRQTFLDTQWYQKAQQAYASNPSGQDRPEANASLEALASTIQGTQPVLFNVENDLNFLRALKVIKEFGIRAWVVGSGHEYRRLETIRATGVGVILPLNFPKAPEVDSPEKALNVSLLELSHWDAAPGNPKRLYDAGVTFVFTATELKKAGDIRKHVQKVIERGLPETAALAALTTAPANLLGVDEQLGSIDAGKLGHLVVTDGALFENKTKLFDVWVDGQRYEIEKKPRIDPRGKWQVILMLPDERTQTLRLKLTGEVKKLSGSFLRDSTSIKMKKVELDHKRLSLSFPGDSLGFDGVILMSGRVNPTSLAGHGQLPDGRRFKWSADSKEPIESKEAESKETPEKQELKQAPLFELGAYAFSKPPEQPEHILVRGATIWTSGPQGKLENADMLVKEGKIAEIGTNLEVPSDAVIIDVEGKHITPGLIDAHSHSGISQGVNESTQAVTSEVRIEDVINNNDIAFYRELAGGLTVANQLHGSANPIGGQNSVIKLRWGASPEELAIKDAIPGIKFALGENVKQSNWGERFTTRYPQTRMGVEQIIRDRFKAALDYEKEWGKYNSVKNKQRVIPPRRDLKLEALLEILHGERLVHSHSYRQDEILMLVRVAEDFGFTIGTFQHVLEGYKVAEALAKHGAGASTFSDWWAYKFEVYDAIPYNGALMHDVGVVVSFNSDSNELARRMNLEAAKAVKYGGVREEEALKFVTLNPAKQLRIHHRVGSLERGKDADFVVWSGSPLSVYAKCQQTWIEGRKYFDIEQDLEMQKQVKAERARLIQKVLASKDKGKNDGHSKGSEPAR